MAPSRLTAQLQSGPDVTATIRPLHSIAARIMEGVGEPNLLLGDNQPIHDTVLKPSQARLLANTDILVWIGPELETFLDNPIRTMAAGTEVVSILGEDILSVQRYSDSLVDPHVWLNTGNAQAIAALVTDKLANADPANSQKYQNNLAGFKKELSALNSEISIILAAGQSRKYLIYHNALNYFKEEFDLDLQSTNSGNEILTPSARQISKIRKLLRSGDYSCVFTDPLTNSSAITSAANDANVDFASLDPLGNKLMPGPQLYASMMKNIARTIADC